MHDVLPALRDLAQVARASLPCMAGCHFQCRATSFASVVHECQLLEERQTPQHCGRGAAGRAPGAAPRLPDKVADVGDVDANLEAAVRQRARVQRIVHIRAACRPQRRRGRTRLEVTLSLT